MSVLDHRPLPSLPAPARSPLDELLGRSAPRRVVNAAGAVSAVGGTRVSERVIAAMADAQRRYVDLDEFNRSVGSALASRLGVADCMVTAGAAHAVMLATAACVTGGRGPLVRHARLREALPRRRVVVQAHHVGSYAPAVESGGGLLAPIGDSERCDEDDLAYALEQGDVAAAAFLVHPGQVRYGLGLGDWVRVARGHGVPVVVDAAASVPPLARLAAVCAAGPDLVAVSGGKGLRGPQASGLLLGRGELVERARACGGTHHGLARVAKVTREAIAGVAVAVADYLALDEAVWLADQRAVLDGIGAAVAGDAALAGCRVEVMADDDEFVVPALLVRAGGRGAADLAGVQHELLAGDPPVYVRHRARFGYLMVVALDLRPAEADLVGARLGAALRAGARAAPGARRRLEGAP